MLQIPDAQELNRYWERNSLGDLFKATDQASSTDVNPGTAALPPKPADLARLHWLITTLGSQTVLEFGVGYSTTVIADALIRNKVEFARQGNKLRSANSNLFAGFSVDADPDWIRIASSRMQPSHREVVTFFETTISIGSFQDRVCHYYDSLPDIVPDFIYLDGPDPMHVHGNVRGISFQPTERTVMAGDLLFLEPTFLPGTTILVDGRTNNARFLQRNFQRDYLVIEDRVGDFTLLQLAEEQLGPVHADT